MKMSIKLLLTEENSVETNDSKKTNIQWSLFGFNWYVLLEQIKTKQLNWMWVILIHDNIVFWQNTVKKSSNKKFF